MCIICIVGLAIPCPEPGCNQVSTSIRQAKSHEKIHRMMTCELCGYVGNLRSYDRHKRVKHTENAKVGKKRTLDFRILKPYQV